MKTLLVTAITASLLAAVVVTVASLMQTPTYEAIARVLVDLKLEEQLVNLGGSGEEFKTLPPPGPGRRQALAQMTMIAIETRPIAEEVIRRLDLRMSPYELLDNLAVEQVETSQFIQLTYTDTDPERATQVVNTFGQVSSERISEADAISNNITATVWEQAEVPVTPASPRPLRNGLIALVVGLVLIGVVATVRWHLRSV
jgi:capsular polysaccharide biosynthesis protein